MNKPDINTVREFCDVIEELSARRGGRSKMTTEIFTPFFTKETHELEEELQTLFSKLTPAPKPILLVKVPRSYITLDRAFKTREQLKVELPDYHIFVITSDVESTEIEVLNTKDITFEQLNELLEKASQQLENNNK